MESLIVFGALAATINKIVSSIKSLKNKDWNTPVTQLLCFLVGVGVVSLAAHSAITEGFALPGFEKTLGELDTGSIVLFALLASSTGSFLYDWKAARDNTDSAAEPKLLSPSVE